MCAFSKPSIPSPQPIQPREDQAKKAKTDQSKRLAKRKGGRQFLTASKGFSGVTDTLLGNNTDKL